MSFFRRRQEPITVYKNPADFVKEDEKNAPVPPWQEGTSLFMKPIPPEPETIPEMPPRPVSDAQDQLGDEVQKAWSLFRRKK